MLDVPVSAAELQRRIEARTALVGVLGLGYVGLPLVVALGEAGCRVLGFDTDSAKPELLNAGRSYIRQVVPERLAALKARELLAATSDMARLDEPDVILICVPTPLKPHLEPDLTHVQASAEAIAARLRRGQLVVLESTTYPGTTEEVVKPILEATGLKAGKDFWLAYSPEREDPGNEAFSATSIPKVVGADDPESLRLARSLYGLFAPATVPVSSCATGEAVKITENVFRAVNIALVNELKTIYARMGIDIWEVIEAAKTKPFGYMPFYPGPGLGGHCVPIDPFYLAWRAQEFGIATRFIELAGYVNRTMPEHVIGELAKALDLRCRKTLGGARVLVLGLAYKKNVDDPRESPAFKLIELLEARQAEVDYYDPYIPVIPEMRAHPALVGRKSIAWDLEALAAYDAVLIATDHDAVDYRTLAETAQLVVDTRNACARGGANLARVVTA